MTKQEFRIHKASIIGHDHLRVKRNNQDGIQTGEVKVGSKLYLYGAICDGCSQGTNNEVGAKLLSRFICGEIPAILSAGTPLDEVPNVLFVRSIGYLRGIAAQTVIGPHEVFVDFVANFLLCTVVGFVMDDETLVIFTAGDGLIIMDDVISRIDQQNKPQYLGYHLVNRSFLTQQSGSLPRSFDTRVLEIDGLNRFALCSDGFEEQYKEKLWGHNKQIMLQRALNKLSRFQNRFSDDCSVIVVERLELAETPGNRKGGD